MLKIGSISRGSIYLANLDPVVGSEINKIRPVVVISNDINNRFSNTITVLPITSNTSKIFPFEVFLKAGYAILSKDSKVKTDQVRTIVKSRLIKEVGVLSDDIVTLIEDALKIHLSI